MEKIWKKRYKPPQKKLKKMQMFASYHVQVGLAHEDTVELDDILMALQLRQDVRLVLDTSDLCGAEDFGVNLLDGDCADDVVLVLRGAAIDGGKGSTEMKE